MSAPLTSRERIMLRDLVNAVEDLMMTVTPERIGIIADHVSEHGTDGDGGIREDGAVLECLRVIVDAVSR